MKTNRLFCLIELAAVAALYFFENNSGTRAALAVSALVPLLSVLCAYRCSRKAALSLDVPRHGEKGAPLVCRLCAPPLLLCEERAELRLQNTFTREEARAAAVVWKAVSLSVSSLGGMDGVTFSGGLPAIRLRRYASSTGFCPFVFFAMTIRF